MTQQNVLQKCTSYALITAGAFVYALSVHIFTLPAHFAPGGITGAASILQTLTHIPAGRTIFVLNIPLMILAYRFLSRHFVIRTIYAVTASSFFIELFEQTNLYSFAPEGNFIIAAFGGGLLAGAGIGLIMNGGGCSGGTDIVGLLIQKKQQGITISPLLFSMNVIVIFSAGLLYFFADKQDFNSVICIVLYSFFEIYTESRILEYVLNGFRASVKFEVITGKPDELSHALLKELERGVTIIKSRGAYTGSENSILFCVVSRVQIAHFKTILKRTDPQAFAYTINTREVLGSGFTSNQ